VGLFSNIRQGRVDAGKPLLFPGIGTVPSPTPGSPGALTPSAGDLANDLKEQERQRQLRITEGRGKINDAFGRFNNDYYAGYGNEITNYYTPQIDEQYRGAMGSARAALKNRGMDQSTVAASAFGDLFRDRNRATMKVANDASASIGQLRGNVERTKTDLYSLNESAADPAAANARASAEASAIVAPPQVSPIGQIFASSLQPILYGAQAYRNRMPAGSNYQTPWPAGGSGQGSGQVIR